VAARGRRGQGQGRQGGRLEAKDTTGRQGGARPDDRDDVRGHEFMQGIALRIALDAATRQTWQGGPCRYYPTGVGWESVGNPYFCPPGPRDLPPFGGPR